MSKTIKLSKCEVEIKDSMNWGDKEAIQSELMKGAKMDQTGLTGYSAGVMLEAKYKTLELMIVNIKEKDKEISFSREWINALSVEDGDKVYEAVDILTKKKA